MGQPKVTKLVESYKDQLFLLNFDMDYELLSLHHYIVEGNEAEEVKCLERCRILQETIRRIEIKIEEVEG